MKKTILLYSLVVLLSSCGGKQAPQQEDQTKQAETPKKTNQADLEALENSSDAIIEQTEKLNQELDSLIDNI